MARNLPAVIWKLPARDIPISHPTRIMGIVNLTDDSFSGDGSLDPQVAADIAREQIGAGADIIDVGAESARTNRHAIPVETEIKRFLAFLDHWPDILATCRPRDATQLWPPVLSANSWRPEVAAAILPHGIELLNDMSALPDPQNAKLCADHGTSLLIMHSVGAPKIPHTEQTWPDVIASLLDFFDEKIALAESAGLPRDAIVLDPGIDFAKQAHDNLTIFRDLDRLLTFKRPILVPISRKTVIGEVLDQPDPNDRDPGTIACAAAAIRRHAHILRVHHVEATYQSVRVLDALGTPHHTRPQITLR